jgi:hypothetical protein
MPLSFACFHILKGLEIVRFFCSQQPRRTSKSAAPFVRARTSTGKHSGASNSSSRLPISGISHSHRGIGRLLLLKQYCGILVRTSAYTIGASPWEYVWPPRYSGKWLSFLGKDWGWGRATAISPADLALTLSVFASVLASVFAQRAAGLLGTQPIDFLQLPGATGHALCLDRRLLSSRQRTGRVESPTPNATQSKSLLDRIILERLLLTSGTIHSPSDLNV